MEEQLTAVLEWLKVRAEGTEKFVLEQAPQYVQEVIAWTFWGGVLQAIATAALVPAALWVVRFCYRANNESGDYLNPGWVLGLLASSAAACVLTGFAGDGVMMAVKAKIAPRVVIVEHLQRR